MGIFNENASMYWEKGLPVIPLQPGEKRPIPLGWSEYQSKLPEPNMQTSWLTAYPDANLGLVLGAQSNICMLDIDTPDPALIKLIESVVPKSPWRRVGKKGCVLAYRFGGHKTFQIKTPQGGMIVELLSAGRQVVLPPSIHPDTKAPYIANSPLLSCLDQLPDLPKDVETILRGALNEAGLQLSMSGSSKISEFISEGARDNALTTHAGILAMAITRGERSFLEACDAIRHWCENFTAKIAGDDVDPDKGIQLIVQFLIRDVCGEKKRILPKGWDSGMTNKEKSGLGLSIMTEEHEEWALDQIKAHLLNEFKKFEGANNPQRIISIEYALHRMARSTKLTSLDEDRLLNWIIHSSGLHLTLSGLRKRIKELRQGEIKGADHTELAQAVKKDLDHLGELRFFNEQFYYWAGSEWKIRDVRDIMRHIADEYGTYMAARRLSDHKGIVGVLGNLTAKKLNTQGLDGINFANGYLTSDLVLKPHDKEYGCTTTLPIIYNPDNDRCERWINFLNSVWSEDEDRVQKIQALREAICATLFGIGPKYQRAIMLYGVAKSGKTQILRVIQSLVPENAWSAIPPTDWEDRFLPSEMEGKILNICGDLSEDRTIKGEKFKLIVEGSMIVVQRKMQQPFNMYPIATHWFASNHIPKTSDTSSGFNRRWLILKFNKPVDDKDKKLEIGNIIVMHERAQIVTWAVKAIKDLSERVDLYLPPSHETELEKVAEANNSVRYFLKASGIVNISPTPLAKKGSRDGEKTLPLTSMMDLHEEYSTFCFVKHVALPVKLRRFRQMMSDLAWELGFKENISVTETGSEVVSYQNITIVENAD